MQTIDPTTGKKIKKYPEFSITKVDAILRRMDKSQREWRGISFKGRAALIKKAGGLLRENKGQYAGLMAMEMGKPVVQGRGEIEKCALICDFYADKAEEFLADDFVMTRASKSYVTYNPLGIVLAVMPWNFPFWQVFRCAVPALMAGNAVVLKHASNVCGCALAIEKIFKDAGFPPMLFANVFVSSKKAKALIQHPMVMAVSLTGSTRAGQSIASEAGAVLKKAVLELGGSDPYIILEDADLDTAAKTCAASRMINGGQSCIAAKRFIVVGSVFKEFSQRFVRHMEDQVMGPPLDEATTLGPMARHDLREGLHTQVTKTLKEGALLLLGGKIPPGAGAFYPPTVLSGVRLGMTAHNQELFGPVASLIKARDEQDALRLANDSVFGLGGAIFSRDSVQAEQLAREGLEAGCCFVNDYVRSDVHLPFGGIKQSGYGRELGEIGIKEFTNIKTVYVK